MPRMQTVFMDSILEHQRDLTNFGLESLFDGAVYGFRLCDLSASTCLGRDGCEGGITCSAISR